MHGQAKQKNHFILTLTHTNGNARALNLQGPKAKHTIHSAPTDFPEGGSLRLVPALFLFLGVGNYSGFGDGTVYLSR